MEGNKRNFSLSIWDHKDNFICLLKSSNSDFEGQSYGEDIVENINGQETLVFNLPLYVFNKEELKFEQNKAWEYIFNEQKIRYTEYDPINNKPLKNGIKEFVIKKFTESRNGEEKIVQCECESLAVYELGKVGWNINFNTEYISNYEANNNDENLLTIDYWMDKILYWESNLGRVSNTTDCTMLLRGLQLRDEEGYPISNAYITDISGSTSYSTVAEPECDLSEEELEQSEYYNPTGWTWEVQAAYKNDPSKISMTTNLYEEPVIDRYIEVTQNNYMGLSWQREIGSEESKLLRHPIEEKDYGKLEYVTDIKRRLFTIERSNIYSIIQELSEIFKVWAKFVYNYDSSGKIIERKIVFRTETINENIVFDFAYGKNLQSCSRDADSNELITKLIVTDTESQISDGNILSIRKSTANPTGEGFLYNFDYFYKLGVLSTYTDEEKLGYTTVVEHSDEYKINYYYGQLKNYNEKISNLQESLVPLYNRQLDLESDLSVQQGSLTGYMDNIQSIQDKIDAIPPEDKVINSWSADSDQYNHVGELKTFSTTTKNNSTYLYINFGREDVLYDKNISVSTYEVNEQEELISGENISANAFKPRIFSYNNWVAGSTTLPDNKENPEFVCLSTGASANEIQINEAIPNYSELGNESFVKGIYFKFGGTGTLSTYARVRYQYVPLAYYYLLIKDYWDKIQNTQNIIDNISENLQEINNRILIKELELNNILSIKKKLIYQFENDYRPYIREGYWEPSDYQPQITSKSLDTTVISSNYEGLIIETNYLKDLKLNDSLHNYSYYIDLETQSSEIDIDSIKIEVKNPAPGSGGLVAIVPWYRGNNYEIFNSNTGNLIIAISPTVIDSYILHNYDISFYKCDITYIQNNNPVTLTNKNWQFIDSSHNPSVIDKYIYLTDDNLLTSSLQIFGVHEDGTSTQLEPFTDYTYSFDYTGYDKNGIRVPLDEQESYSTDITYDYITKITLKNTNHVNSIINNKFIVYYTEETTLDYLYNDAVAMGEEYSSPKITYTVSVLDISKLNGYENYKPILGQKVPIWDIEMGLKGYEGFITTISKELEAPENTQIGIATYETRFEDIFQKLTATVSNISYNENSIFTAANSFNTDGTIKTQVFQKALEDNNLRIAMGVNNDISIDETNGIVLRDRDNNRAVKLIGNGIFLTENSAAEPVQWRTGITGEGINADAINGGSIDTKDITIWNSAEGQYRFRWNEQGLFAFGDKFGGITTSASTYQDLIDYNKYVKFNQEGLDFSDNGKSALKLTWQGLRIETQERALTLDANKGLILKDNNEKNRLELGYLNNNLYGLRLSSTTGQITFQNDSGGDLWLQRHIRMGGTIDNNSVVQNPTAGVYGLTDNVPEEMQMGLRRNDSGDVIWDSAPIRFWAGPQSKSDYKDNIHISNSDINASIDSTIINNNLNKLSDNQSPTLAKFKVSANGDIIASGIDVGGWIGQGDKLHSSDNQAILRSNGYDEDISGHNYPVIAVGKPDNPDIDYGSNYIFRVYQDGTVYSSRLKIGKDTEIEGLSNTTTIEDMINDINHVSTTVEKIVNLDSTSGLSIVSTINNLGTSVNNIANLTDTSLTIYQTLFNSDGTSKILTESQVTAIAAGSVDLSNIGGFVNTSSGSDPGLDKSDSNYYVGLRAPQSTTTIVFYAGTTGIADENNAFWVKADGSVKASNIILTGNGTGDFINAGNDKFIVNKDGTVTATNIKITGGNGNWIIDSNEFQVTNTGYIGAGVIPVSRPTSFNADNYDFSVSNGDIKFRGNIYAYYGGWKKGLDYGTFTLGNITLRVVQGLVVSV